MGKMYVLNDSGHAEKSWLHGDEESTRGARHEFKRLRTCGYVPFGKRRTSSEPERIRTFDSHLEEIFWVRPITGG